MIRRHLEKPYARALPSMHALWRLNLRDLYDRSQYNYIQVERLEKRSPYNLTTDRLLPALRMEVRDEPDDGRCCTSIFVFAPFLRIKNMRTSYQFNSMKSK